MDAILKKLKGHPLFSGLNQAELEDVASAVEKKSYHVGDNLFQQGREAEYFYIITKGQLELLQENEQGEIYPISYLYADEFCGDIALLYNEPYGGTVRAMEDSEALVIYKDDFLDLLSKYPKLNKKLDMLGREIEKRTSKSFDGQMKGEMILYFKRRHWIALVQRFRQILFIMFLWALALVFAYLFFDSNPNQERWRQVITVALMFLIVPAALSLWQVLDWLNDYYIITNERVIKIEKVIGLLNERYEIPLVKIQNVTIDYPSPVGPFLGYGQVTIATSARQNPKKKADSGGLLVLDYMPNAERIANRIMKELNREKQLLAQRQVTQKRQAIRDKLGIKSPADSSSMKQQKPSGSSKPAPKKSRWTSFRRWWSNKLNFFIPSMRHQTGDMIMWRKHWIILWRDWAVPLLLLSLVLSAIWLVEPLLLDLGIPSLAIWGVSGFLVFIHLLWLAWLYEDWRNDMYILNADAILDEQMQPFGFNQQVRRASLDAIQDIRFIQRNPLWVWFRVGHVLVQTAGEDGDFTFNWVYNPREVQLDIFRYIQQRKLQRQQRQVAVINQEILEMLKLYDEERNKQPAPAPLAPTA